MKGYSVFCGLLLLLLSCGNKSLIPAAYLDWIRNPENGIRQQQEGKDALVTLQYVTREAMALERMNPESFSPEAFEQELLNTDSMYYFRLILQTPDKKQDILKYKILNQDDYYARLNYLVSGLEKDIFMVVGGDSIPCHLSHTERNYSLSSEQVVHLAFRPDQRLELNKDWLIFLNLQLPGYEDTYKFFYKESLINSIPRVKTEI